MTMRANGLWWSKQIIAAKEAKGEAPTPAIADDDAPPLQAIGYVRVGGGGSTAAATRQRIKATCKRWGLDLLRVVEEDNEAPETTPMQQRDGLLEAVAAAGRDGGASVLVADAADLGGTDPFALDEAVRLTESAGARLLLDGRYWLC